MRTRHIKILRRNVSVSVFFVMILALTVVLLYPKIHIFKKAPEKIPGIGVAETIKSFSFVSPNALKEWEEKVFKGKVIYKLKKDQGVSYVSAVSNNAASALYYRIKADAKSRRPVVSWRWRAEKFPVKKFAETLEKENEDDYAARIYVIFPAMFITNSKVLEYVWAETLPVGSTGTSPYSKNIKLIVLRSGIDKDKSWFAEERDVVADYVKMFGRSPEYDLGAVAFMTNTEHTASQAEASYGDIKIGYRAGIAREGGKNAD